jgi:signal transduction histidine kinase
MGLFDLSLRYKLPLWGSVLIVASALTLSLSFMGQARDDLKRDMLASSESLGRTLARTLQSALLHDDVWRGFEIVNAPYGSETPSSDFRAEGIIVLNNMQEVFVSSQPDAYPLLASLDKLGPAFHALHIRLGTSPLRETLTLEAAGKILLALPMTADEIVLGHLILVHPSNYFSARYKSLIWKALLITAAALMVLLPINWYWGQRVARPLLLLSSRMDKLGRALPEPLPPGVYAYRDELGHLFDAYGRMLEELQAKTALEHELVKEDRLAALGRLSAGIAHEINNPLGGLMTAVDTLKQHGNHDPVSARVLPLLERGLVQIKEIVAALLVEAKAKTRPLIHQDIEDVHTLLAQEARKRGVQWTWRNELKDEAALPATLVRQVLINLVLNAVQAASPNGQVEAAVAVIDGALRVRVGNNGQAIPPELMEHLFEPFTGLREGGHGLGLWITYQIVQQLHGTIEVNSQDGWTKFNVNLPLSGESCTTAEFA